MNQEGVKYQIVSQLVASEVGDETVILNYSKGQYFSTEGVGSVIWTALQAGSKSLEELTHAVLEEFDIDEETCQADIENFIQNLLRSGLAKVVEN